MIKEKIKYLSSEKMNAYPISEKTINQVLNVPLLLNTNKEKLLVEAIPVNVRLVITMMAHLSQ